MDEVDNAMANGYIDNSLPYMKREAMALLRNGYQTHEQAREMIPAELTGYYEENYPQILESKAEAISAAAAELVKIYTSNVFPDTILAQEEENPEILETLNP